MTTRTSTTTSTADERGGGDGDPPRRAGVALVLEADRLSAGGALLTTSEVTRVVIGRGPARVVTAAGRGARRVELPDPTLSSRHAELRLESGRWSIRDAGSRNGTFVDGRQVGEAQLDASSVVRLGHCFFVVVDDVAAPPAGPRVPLAMSTLAGPLARALDRLDRLAPSPLPLLLLGETGTGKEVVARRVHERSGRPGPFVAVNCGAFPKDLVESALFGHVRGAFSGAVRDEPGFVRAADGGTLLLDELGELPLGAQAALLRVLQEGEVCPIGTHRPVRVDVRVLAATHRPLERMLKDGTFRADLYARLAGFVARLPSLRDRRCDLGMLAATWIAEGRLPDLLLRWEAAERLIAHDWPFNARELLQVLQAAALLAEGAPVRVGDLPELAPLSRPTSSPPSNATLSPEDAALRDDLARRLEATGGNLSQVAREMNKARQQIQRWVKRFGLRV
jgi:transcriptional regulator of acetoin/glycerol metabolism